MSRRFTIVTLALTAVVAFLVGAIVAGGFMRPSVVAQAPRNQARLTADRAAGAGTRGPLPPLVNFADVVERINPAVVNIDATSSGAVAEARRRRSGLLPDSPEMFEAPRREAPRRGAGSGFIIDADGSILTNNHVIDGAERILVKLSDGRSLRARVIGADPDTDIALLKVDGQNGLPVAPLGDSTSLRMGEWVCAIGNPLGYEHSVTVGVVSYLGRKLFDTSLDDYIQTDAAINFGNSGGPLINARGEVIGINAAISSRASNIGFAVPINGAKAILPQLKTRGRVSRGYVGITLRDLDPDLQRSLNIPVSRGAVIQDVTDGSPGARAGLRPYDVVVSFEGVPVATDDELIHEISSRAPGSTADMRVVRDAREFTATVKLTERPAREGGARRREAEPRSTSPPPGPEGLLGLTVRDLDAAAFNRLRLPAATRGVLIARVDPVGPASDAEVQRGTVLMEINRKPILSLADYTRVAAAIQPGDVITLYVYAPDVAQRQLKTVRIDDR
ncbi:MAG: trypsin-like peptidase domain-containing protein [Vicinamibacterales bacterium]